MKTFGPKNPSNQKLQVESVVEGTIEGSVADDNLSVDNPLVQGGVYRSDPTLDTLEDGYVGEVLINNQRMLVVEDRVYDSASDSNKQIPVFIPQDRYSFEDLSGSQADSDATVSYYVSFEGFSFFSLQWEISGDGYQALKVYASNEDSADITALNYFDVTNDWFDSTEFNTDAWLERDTVCSCKALRIDNTLTSLNPGDTASWSMYLMKKGA
jgi:hypothetical protein